MKPKAKKPTPRSPAPPLAEPGMDLLSMADATRLLRTSRSTFYRMVRRGAVKATKVGRQWRFQRGDLERFLKGQPPRVDLPVDPQPLVASLEAYLERLGGHDESPAGSTDLQRVVRLTITIGSKMQGSDIHVMPQVAAEGERQAQAVIRVRVDGVMQTVAEFDLRLLVAIVEEWKRMAACDVQERRRPQDGRILIETLGRSLDLRVCFVPAQLGEALTVRILDRAVVILNLDRIDYAVEDRRRLDAALRSPAGLVILTGPTGCGKTTVLYACLNQVNRPEIKVMSVEDPVEYLLAGVVQVPVMPAAGMTFATALRSFLRSDPDVILVGEIRDREALLVCQQVALTGHLVMTTLHTNDAAAALSRMVEIGSEPFLVADTTKLVLAQRLLRLLCPKCSRPGNPAPVRLTQAEQAAREGGLNVAGLTREFRVPVGCSHCNHTGYRGRTVIAETLEVGPALAEALRQRAPSIELRALAVRHGMTTMAADGFRRAARGQTTVDEVLRVLAFQ